MENKKYGFRALAVKSLSVISTSLGLLTGNHALAIPPDNENNTVSDLESITFKRKADPKLVLKINPNNLLDGKLIAGHSSHSSHSSHRSHSSHYSSSYSSDSNGGGGGIGVGALLVGGLVAAGAYQLGKSKRDKK